MNISLLNVGLPTLARQLGASNAGLEWIVDAYNLVFAGFLLTAGSLGDRIGRERVWMEELAIFGSGAVLADAPHDRPAHRRPGRGWGSGRRASCR